jgi:hypothetical protein
MAKNYTQLFILGIFAQNFAVVFSLAQVFPAKTCFWTTLARWNCGSSWPLTPMPRASNNFEECN